MSEIIVTTNQVCCNNGHELNADDVYIEPTGRKRCKKCRASRYKKWKKKNTQKLIDYKKQWRIKNKENISEKAKNKYLQNSEKIKQRTKRNSNLKRFNGKREKIIKRDRYKCVNCGMSREQHKEKYVVDLTINHIDGKGRKSRKPNNSDSNLETLCLRCHGKKDSERYWNER